MKFLTCYAIRPSKYFLGGIFLTLEQTWPNAGIGQETRLSSCLKLNVGHISSVGQKNLPGTAFQPYLYIKSKKRAVIFTDVPHFIHFLPDEIA
ncbi:MAG: hypothetical protein WBA61_05235 [Aequorivita sp.]